MNEYIFFRTNSPEFFWFAMAWVATGLMWTTKRTALANRIIEHIQRAPIEPDLPIIAP